MFPMSIWHDNHHDNPLRDPAWRWNLAIYLVERQLRVGRSARVSFELQRFAAALAAAATEFQRFQLCQEYPHLCPAWSIYGLRGRKKRLRFEIEARLLGGEAHAEIARKTGHCVAVISAYSKTFFDVEGRLNCPSFITHFVTNAPRNCQRDEYEPQVVWKILGYAYGPAMVDFLVYGSVQSRKAVSAEEIPAVITSEVLNQVKRQTLVGVHSPHLDQPTKNQLVANFL